MPEFTDAQWDGLRSFNKLVRETELDLLDSFETGYMSDSKSSVFAMMNAAEALDLPDGLANQLHEMARESWSGATSSGEAASRAGKAIAAVGKIERLLEEVCITAGRAL